MKARCGFALLTALAMGIAGCDEKSKEHAEKAKQATKDAAASAGEALKEGAKAAGEAVKDAAAKTGEKVGDAAVKTGEALKESASKLNEPKPGSGTATAELLAPARETMKGYLDSMTKSNSLMEGIKSPLDATPKLTELKGTFDSISAKATELLKLTPEQQTALRNEFKDTLSPALNKFKAEAERISKDSGLGKLVGDAVKNVKLFE